MSRCSVKSTHRAGSYTPLCLCQRDGLFSLFQRETIGVVLELKGLRGCDFGMGLPLQLESFSVLNEFLFALYCPAWTLRYVSKRGYVMQEYRIP